MAAVWRIEWGSGCLGGLPWKPGVSEAAGHGDGPPLAHRGTRVRAAGAGILTVGLHRVSICRERRISTMDMRLDARDRALTLTVEMHRASSRFGYRGSTSDPTLFRDGGRAHR